MIAIDNLRDRGKKVGLVRLRLWRPFSFDELRAAVSHVDTIIVLDRAISFGGPMGPVCSEIQAALYPLKKRPNIVSFIGGLGGRDVTSQGFERIIIDGIEKSASNRLTESEMIEVRG